MCGNVWQILFIKAVLFLGGFANLLKATISSAMSAVCLSVRPSECSIPLDGSSWNLIFEHFLENLLRKFNFHYNLPLVMGTLYEHLFTFMKMSLSFLLRVSLRQKIYRKSKTHILFLTTVVPKWGLLRFNIEKCGRARHAADNNITRCMRFACWITEATDTHSKRVIRCIFAATKFARKGLNIMSVSTLLSLSLLM
jgi:hypothetical protein